MKKKILALLLVKSIFADEMANSTIEFKQNNQTITYSITIKDNAFYLPNGDYFTNDSDIIIMFSKEPDISFIEQNFNLKFNRKSLIGNYYFETLDKNCFQAIKELIKNPSLNIKNISPNLVKKASAF